jgi:hypothetical protein
MSCYGVDPDALALRLIDDFSRAVLQGALRVAKDDGNPIRGNLFASAIREVLTHVLHELAPDDDVKRCDWFQAETDNGRPTRAQRQRYVIQGGLSDRYVMDTLQLDVDNLRRQLSNSIKALHRATHLRPGTVVGDSAMVNALAEDALGSLAALMDAIDHCRQEMMEAVDEAVVNEATDEVLSETIQTIDEIATHHSIEEVYVDDVKTVKIDAYHVWYRATGTIGAELQWGSNSDLRRGDGATLNHSFPFVCDIPAPVEEPDSFDSSMIDLRVSDGGWRD